MANVLLKVEETVLPSLAQKIMSKTGRSEPMTLPEFGTEVDKISGGSDLPVAEESSFGYEATGNNKFYYNGVPLPEIPQEVLAEAPYCWIKKDDIDGCYELIMGEGEYILLGGSMKNGQATPPPLYKIPISDSGNADGWGVQQDHIHTGFTLDEYRTILWSNFDVYDFDTSGHPLYFEATEPVPVPDGTVQYQINGSTLTDIADSILRKTGKTDLMTASEMSGEIDGITTGGGGSGGTELNIHYGDTAPEDTTKLWCKCAEPSSVLVSNAITGTEQLEMEIATLPKKLVSMGIGVVGKKCYVFGGQRTTGTTTATGLYDAETNTASSLSTSLPEARKQMAVGVVGEKCYLFGGYGASDYLSSIRIFDTETETFTSSNVSLPFSGNLIGVGVIGTKIYLFGGYQSSGKICVYDTETDTINTLGTSLGDSDYYANVGVVGTKCYLFYGTSVRVFDTVTETLTSLSVTSPVDISEACVGVIGSKMYLIGGSQNVIYEFDTKTETFTALTTILTSKLVQHGIGVVGSKIYIFGGGSSGASSTFTNTVHEFAIELSLEAGKLLIQSNLTDNIFNILNGDATAVEIGVDGVYLGNSNNEGELVDSFLYQNEAWTQI